MRLSIFALVPLLLWAGTARADGDPERDARVQRLLEAKRTLKWNHELPRDAKSRARYGHAEALVAAPVDKVQTAIVDFAHYKDLHRKFSSARVIAKEGGATDVYMRYPVKIGPIKLELWEVMRFGAVRTNGGDLTLEGRALSKGDMKQGHTIITVKRVDATQSLLAVDILLTPKVPAPQSLIDEELRDGAEDFVNGLKDRAQANK